MYEVLFQQSVYQQQQVLLWYGPVWRTVKPAIIGSLLHSSFCTDKVCLYLLSLIADQYGEVKCNGRCYSTTQQTVADAKPVFI